MALQYCSKKLISSFVAPVLAALLASCSDSERQHELSETIASPSPKSSAAQTNKPEKGNVAPEQQTTEKESEEKTSPTIAETLPSDSDTTKPELSQKDSLEQQLAELESRLQNDNQENATLRQHMDILLKKVQENQRVLDEFEQRDK